MINDRFKSYFQETFFAWKEEEFQLFLSTIEKPILRTIRIKADEEESVKNRLEKDGWILTSTTIPRVYCVDRREDFDPFERRLGFSVDHLIGNFYIQELAAAHPVDILADSTVQSDDFLILDMASSPGGKTTQLAEYYPNSWIIANEPTRERIPQLLQNLERMETPNVWVTLYPGQYWKNIPELFDRILLDAPCSGEGTLYKWTDAVKHWHLKNIKDIARLQAKLLDASLHTLKVGWEMIYSTCSLNLIENEWVIATMYEKYGDIFEVIFEKKFWPHIDGTGGFYVAKIRKTQSIPTEESRSARWGKNEKLKVFRWDIYPWKILPDVKLYEHDKKILATKNTLPTDYEIYFMRFGEQIGAIENGRFEPSAWAHRYLDISDLTHHELWTEWELDEYLRWNPIVSRWDDISLLLSYEGQVVSLEWREDNIIKNSFPKDWRRK